MIVQSIAKKTDKKKPPKIRRGYKSDDFCSFTTLPKPLLREIVISLCLSVLNITQAMKIYRDSQVIADVFLLDGSYTSEAISGEHLAYLEFDTLEPLALEVDDRIEYGGNRYFLQSQEHRWAITIK